MLLLDSGSHKRHDGRSDANVFLCHPVFTTRHQVLQMKRKGDDHEKPLVNGLRNERRETNVHATFESGDGAKMAEISGILSTPENGKERT